MTLHHGDTFIRYNREYTVTFPFDVNHAEPWKDAGHGVISEWVNREPNVGERLLFKDGGWFQYYDTNATLQRAMADGWGTHDGPLPNETPAAYAVRAVEADFAFCYGWANDEWQYVGVFVRCVIDGEDNADETASLWGIESISTDYLEEVAFELADEIHERLCEQEEEAERVEREKRGYEYGVTL